MHIDLPPGTPDCIREFAKANPDRISLGPTPKAAPTPPAERKPAGKRPGAKAGGLIAPFCSRLPGGGVAFGLPIATVSEANARGWQEKSNRTRHARAVVSRYLGPNLRALAPFAERYHAGGPIRVRLVRLGGRRLDKLANLGAALKAVEDAVALMLGADDGDPRWRAEADQEECSVVGVRIELSFPEVTEAC